MKVGSEIKDVKFIEDGNPFFFGVFSKHLKYPRTAYGVINQIAIDGIDFHTSNGGRSKSSRQFILSLYDFETCKFLDYNMLSEVICEIQIDKGSWRKLDFEDDAEEAKVLMISDK